MALGSHVRKNGVSYEVGQLMANGGLVPVALLLTTRSGSLGNKQASIFQLSKYRVPIMGLAIHNKLASIRCKKNVRWQHLSRMKSVLFEFIKLFLSCLKSSRLSSGTSNAIYNWKSISRIYATKERSDWKKISLIVANCWKNWVKLRSYAKIYSLYWLWAAQIYYGPFVLQFRWHD